jgi:hypothetical protein
MCLDVVFATTNMLALALGYLSSLTFHSKILRGPLEIPADLVLYRSTLRPFHCLVLIGNSLILKQMMDSYDVCLTRDISVILVGRCH